MEFILLPFSNMTPAQTSLMGSTRILSSAQLARAAEKESKNRAVPADPSQHTALLSGAALRELCLAQLRQEETQIHQNRLVPEQLSLLWLQPWVGSSRPPSCKLLPAAAVASHFFHLSELQQPHTLVVLTVFDNLEHFAHAHSSLYAAQPPEEEEEGRPESLSGPPPDLEALETEGAEENGEAPRSTTTTPSSLTRPGVRRPRPDDTNTPNSLPSGPGIVPAKRLHREVVYESVSASIRHNDIEAVNELMDSRGFPPRLERTIVPYACRRCRHLPQFTLTMSCCGAVLCSRCVPSPPTVADIAREERLCPVCQEEPLEPPQSHPSRDEQVHRLVKELKVLYHQQLKAGRRAAGKTGEGDVPALPPPPPSATSALPPPGRSPYATVRGGSGVLH